MKYCINCGKQISKQAKFCPECGTSQENFTNLRETKYEGTIHKCPNCGETIDSFTMKCPSCSIEIRDNEESNSLKKFKESLESIDFSYNSQPVGGVFRRFFKNQNNDKKITLIRCFPIPNNKEDIYEFMLLAAANIDFKLYGLGDRGILSAAQRDLSDAWLSKLEQAYQKAKILFGSTPEFVTIKEIYDTQIKRMKKEKMKLSIILISVFGSFLCVFGLIFLILSLNGVF